MLWFWKFSSLVFVFGSWFHEDPSESDSNVNAAAQLDWVGSVWFWPFVRLLCSWRIWTGTGEERADERRRYVQKVYLFSKRKLSEKNKKKVCVLLHNSDPNEHRVQLFNVDFSLEVKQIKKWLVYVFIFKSFYLDCQLYLKQSYIFQNLFNKNWTLFSFFLS